MILIVACEAERPIGRADVRSPSGSGETAATAPVPPAASAPAPPLDGQGPGTPPAPTGSAPLCLELEAPRSKVQLGEPVTLIASLVNCSRQAQQLQDLLSPAFGFLQVRIQPPGGAEMILRPTANRDARGKPARLVAPGERLTAFVPVYFGADGWVMKQPGTYRVRAEYGAEATKLESKPVQIMVLAPETAIDRQAAELMMTRETGMFLMSGRDERGEGERRLTAIEQEYGRSRLAPYARLALATAESRDRFDPKTKTFRQDGCERATERLARAVPQVGDPLLAATGTTSWIRCLRKLGRESEVGPAISLFYRSHPEAKVVISAEFLETPARKN